MCFPLQRTAVNHLYNTKSKCQVSGFPEYQHQIKGILLYYEMK
jgi:hypothetical protein